MPSLASVTVSGPNPTLRVGLVHGILGSGRNWRSFARSLIQARPDLSVELVDLRHHGDSPGLAGPNSVAACAEDLIANARSWEVVIGHSFGGKVALELARRSPSLRQVISLDSPPFAGEVPQGTDVEQVVAALHQVRQPAPQRGDLRAALAGFGLSEMLVAWLLTSARESSDGWRFVWDLAAIDELLRSYFDYDPLPWLASGDHPPVHFLRAGRSDRWPVDTAFRLALPGVHLDHLPNAGHWVQVDDPDGLLRYLVQVLPPAR